MEAQWKAAPICRLSASDVQNFANRYLERNGLLISLSDTRDTTLMFDLSARACEVFADTINEMKTHLECAETGIVAVDIPEVFDDATADATIGSLTAVALSQAITPNLPDRENKTPFSIFTASKDNSEKLDQIGIRGLSPVDVLEFHSDGSIADGLLSVPDYISLFNVFINYYDRGYFYWVPTRSITGFPEIVERAGFGKDYYFSLTPAVYNTTQSDLKVIDRRAKAAIFSLAGDGTVTTFMNGTFEGPCETSGVPGDIVSQIKTAISTNSIRYFVPQESRRLIMLNNANGFHARDIFERPMNGCQVTRAYLRSASISGKIVGNILED
ncbi:hypothetical protein WKW50_24660 [Ochrobactrum sp. GPK 3]